MPGCSHDVYRRASDAAAAVLREVRAGLRARMQDICAKPPGKRARDTRGRLMLLIAAFVGLAVDPASADGPIVLRSDGTTLPRATERWESNATDMRRGAEQRAAGAIGRLQQSLWREDSIEDLQAGRNGCYRADDSSLAFYKRLYPRRPALGVASRGAFASGGGSYRLRETAFSRAKQARYRKALSKRIRGARSQNLTALALLDPTTNAEVIVLCFD